MLTIETSQMAWEQALNSSGFGPPTNGVCRRDGLVAHASQTWMTFEQLVNGVADELAPDVDRRGLWKLVTGRDGMPRYEFQVPAALVGRDSEEDRGDDSPLRACIDWVLATREGQLPRRWQAPPRSKVEGWIPQGGLSVQRGPFAVQGLLTCHPERLKIAFQLTDGTSEHLSDNRWVWLRQVLLHAQNQWRLVRIVLREERGETNIAVEVDLSGAPPLILEELFTVSLDALRWVVSWLICPVSLLADSSVKCSTWEQPPESFLLGGKCNE